MASRSKIAWGLAAAVAALASAPLTGQEPAATENAAQAPAGSSRTLVLSLEDALRIAEGESEEIWVAEAGAMRALGNVRIARSQRFPQVSATASYTRTLRSQFSGIDFGGPGGEDPGGGEDLGDLPFGRENQYTLALQLSQTVFDAGQTSARNRAAQARRRSADFDVTAARAQTLLEVTEAYFDAQLSDRLVEIAEASLGQSEEVLRQTQVARRVGDKSEYELLRARVARDNQLPVLIRRRSERSESYLRLKQLLEVPLEDELVLTTGVEEPQTRFLTASDASPEQRLPVRQAAENVRASEEQLAETRGQRLPSVALTSRYAPVAYPPSGLPEPGDFREDWTVTLSLTVPILTWGRLRGSEMVARGTLSEAQARLEQARETAALELRTSRNDLADAEAALAGNTSTAQEAQRAYAIAQIRFREGLSSQIELADAQLLREQAEVNRAQALRDVQVARARLALLQDLPLGIGGIGGGPPSFQPAQPVQPSPVPQQPTVPGQVTAGFPGQGAGGFAGAPGPGSPLP